MIDRLTFTIGPTVGSNGAASAEFYGPAINGEVYAVHLDYGSGHPATTDVYFWDKDDPLGENTFYRQNANANIKFYPRRKYENNAGTVILYPSGQQVRITKTPFIGRIYCQVNQSNPGLYVTVTLWIVKNVCTCKR